MNAAEIGRFARALRDPTATVVDLVSAADARAARFDVHRNNVAGALLEALRTAFPALRRLLGDEYFDAFAAEFARARPPRTQLLVDYGDGLPDFVERFPPLAPYPYLADVARLERLRVRAYHARDEVALSPEQLAARVAAAGDVPGALRLASSAGLVMSAHPVHAIWRAQVDGADTWDPDAGAEAVLVWRREFDVETVSIEDATGRFLEHVAAGRSLHDALDAVGEDVVGFELTLARLLRDGALVPGDEFNPDRKESSA